jgi:hypothetical protein
MRFGTCFKAGSDQRISDMWRVFSFSNAQHKLAVSTSIDRSVSRLLCIHETQSSTFGLSTISEFLGDSRRSQVSDLIILSKFAWQAHHTSIVSESATRLQNTYPARMNACHRPPAPDLGQRTAQIIIRKRISLTDPWHISCNGAIENSRVSSRVSRNWSRRKWSTLMKCFPLMSVFLRLTRPSQGLVGRVDYVSTLLPRLVISLGLRQSPRGTQS